MLRTFYGPATTYNDALIHPERIKQGEKGLFTR